MKRFRDMHGKLLLPIEEIERLTVKEAETYYQVGEIYLYAKNKDEYVYIEKDTMLAHFYSFSGKHLFIPLDSLGTFLPDVASTECELVLINDD